jgi:hypothetical protein
MSWDVASEPYSACLAINFVDVVDADVIPPLAVATQEQTARAEDETCRPVTAPQPLIMQSNAVIWIADN